MGSLDAALGLGDNPVTYTPPVPPTRAELAAQRRERRRRHLRSRLRRLLRRH